MEIEHLLLQIEAFYRVAARTEGFQGMPESLPPAPPERIAELTERRGVIVPDDVQRFWKRGLQYSSVHVGTPGSGDFATAYFDWLAVDDIAEEVDFLRGVAAQCDGEERRVLETSLPLTRSPSRLLSVCMNISRTGELDGLLDAFDAELDSWESKLAGSVFGLEPGTSYDLELTLSDPDGGDATENVTVATRPVPVVPAGAR